MKEAQQSTKVGKSSFTHLQPINEVDPNIVINDVINDIATTTYRNERTEK